MKEMLFYKTDLSEGIDVNCDGNSSLWIVPF